MRFIFLLFISFLFVNAAVAQDKKAPTQEQLKELSRIQNEKYENQKKKEWDAYLVRVEADKLAKKQKKVADSIEKSKITDNVKNDIDDFTKCSVQELPYFKVKNYITKLEELKSFDNYIKIHIYNKFRYPEFAIKHELQGRVMVHFIIDKEGNPQIKEAIGPKNGLILEEEAIRIIKSLPTAIPANCDGKPINISYAIPIMFQMEE